MAELTDAEIAAAMKRGRAAQAREPRVANVRYDRKADHIVMVLTNGTIVSIPRLLLQGLEQAKADQIADVRVQGEGYGLSWPALDIDHSVPGLLAGVFGTRSFLARKAGMARSRAKAAAARRNGAKGGRPRKSSAA